MPGATAADVVGEVPAALDVEPVEGLEAVALPPALTDADWPTQLESGPAWMVIGEEYWTLPSLSRTWMVIEVCAARFTVHTNELVCDVGKLSRAAEPG